MKILAILGILLAISSVMALTIDGEGSGVFIVKTHTPNFDDVMSINSYHFDVDASIADSTIDRRVDMNYVEPYPYSNQVEFDTVHSDGVTHYNYISSTYTSGHVNHGESWITQNYDGNSFIQTRIGRFPSTFVSSIDDGASYNYGFTHTTSGGLMDEIQTYKSTPKVDFGSAGGADDLNVYASSSFTTDVNGLLLDASANGMFGFNPTLANEVDVGTREGTHIDFSGSFHDVDYGIDYGGTWHFNHDYMPVGFTIEKQ